MESIEIKTDGMSSIDNDGIDIVLETNDPVEPKGEPAIVDESTKDTDVSKEEPKEDDDNQQTTEEKIDVDGVVYVLDSQGNAVDEQGNVKFTADEIKGFEEPTEEGDKLYDTVSSLTNIKPVDENGKPITYENTPEGISEYVKDVFEIAKSQGAEETTNSLFSTYPALYDALLYIQSNGDLNGYAGKVDYSKVEISEDNKDQLKNIIVTARKARGESNEKIDKYIKYLEDSNSLLDDAKEEQAFLVEKDKEVTTARQKAIEDQRAAELQQAQEYWGVAVDDNGNIVNLDKANSIYSTVKNGKLEIDGKVYTIPEKIKVADNGKVKYQSRDDFFNYLYAPKTYTIDNQKVTMTQHDYDVHLENTKRNVSHDVFDAFKRFVKYDTSQFIKENVNNENAKQIIKRVTTKRNKQTPTGTPKQGNDVKIVVPTNS